MFSHVRILGESLTRCLAQVEDLSSATFCHDTHSLLTEARDRRADVVLVDMSHRQNHAAAKALATVSPQPQILAMGVPENIDEILVCVDLGCAGFVPRDATLEELRAIIRDTLKGECACHPKIAGGLMRELWRRRRT